MGTVSRLLLLLLQLWGWQPLRLHGVPVGAAHVLVEALVNVLLRRVTRNTGATVHGPAAHGSTPSSYSGHGQVAHRCRPTVWSGMHRAVRVAGPVVLIRVLIKDLRRRRLL